MGKLGIALIVGLAAGGAGVYVGIQLCKAKVAGQTKAAVNTGLNKVGLDTKGKVGGAVASLAGTLIEGLFA